MRLLTAIFMQFSWLKRERVKIVRACTVEYFSYIFNRYTCFRLKRKRSLYWDWAGMDWRKTRNIEYILIGHVFCWGEGYKLLLKYSHYILAAAGVKTMLYKHASILPLNPCNKNRVLTIRNNDDLIYQVWCDVKTFWKRQLFICFDFRLNEVGVKIWKPEYANFIRDKIYPRIKACIKDNPV